MNLATEPLQHGVEAWIIEEIIQKRITHNRIQRPITPVDCAMQPPE
jgi:hypothetical protein